LSKTISFQFFLNIKFISLSGVN